MKTPKQLHNQTTELKTVLHLIFSFDQDYTKETNITQPNSTRIRHTVVFKLNHAKGSPEEHAFLTAAKELSSIAGVLQGISFRQPSSTKFTNYE